jgi:hypothetical protein
VAYLVIDRRNRLIQPEGLTASARYVSEYVSVWSFVHPAANDASFDEQEGVVTDIPPHTIRERRVVDPKRQHALKHVLFVQVRLVAVITLSGHVDPFGTPGIRHTP